MMFSSELGRGERERRKAFISSLKYAHSPTRERGAAKIFPRNGALIRFLYDEAAMPCPCDPTPGQREDEIQWLPDCRAGFAWFWWETEVKKCIDYVIYVFRRHIMYYVPK